jgi:hypothetical protein
MPFAIENNIPVPPVKQGRKTRNSSKYPFARLAIGQSTSAPLPTNAKLRKRVQVNMRAAAANASKRNSDLAFTSRIMVEKGQEVFRMWRVAKPATPAISAIHSGAS